MPCTFGFNEESLESIKRTMSSLDLDLRRGSLVWDEMSISKSLNFDAQKLRFEGFADYGLDEINADPKAATDQLADHCLVFIFRPYRASWVQPIAFYRICHKRSGTRAYYFTLVTESYCGLGNVWSSCNLCNL